jgi:hypothetical protein
MVSKTYDERQQLILDATQRLIAEAGVESVSMADIAAATGLSRTAIYQYFSSRSHVLAELVINEMADLSNALDSHLAKIPEAKEQIRVWVHYTLAHLSSSDHRVIREISMDTLPPESRGMITAMHGHFMTSLINPLTEIGVAEPVATFHLILASVSEAAKRIDAGGDFVREAGILEKFTIAGIKGATQ